MLLKLHPANPSQRKVDDICEMLRKDGVIIFPTDTVYALACALDSKKGFERICRIKQIKPKDAVFSIIASDVSQAAEYLGQIATPDFRVMNRNLPGPFTFILKGSKKLPPHMRNGRDTVGVRIPDHEVTNSIVKGLGMPIVTTSLRSEDEILEYHIDPEEIHERYVKIVDAVVDSGPGDFYPSTIVDMSGEEMTILRTGKGELAL